MTARFVLLPAVDFDNNTRPLYVAVDAVVTVRDASAVPVRGGERVARAELGLVGGGSVWTALRAAEVLDALGADVAHAVAAADRPAEDPTPRTPADWSRVLSTAADALEDGGGG